MRDQSEDINIFANCLLAFSFRFVLMPMLSWTAWRILQGEEISMPGPRLQPVIRENERYCARST